MRAFVRVITGTKNIQQKKQLPVLRMIHQTEAYFLERSVLPVGQYILRIVHPLLQHKREHSGHTLCQQAQPTFTQGALPCPTIVTR